MNQIQYLFKPAALLRVKRMVEKNLPWSKLAVAVLFSIFGSTALAQATLDQLKTRDNLMVVVRESAGVNKQDETLRPFGKMRAKLPDGREIELEMAWWEFIGDTQVRFVFDGDKTMINAVPSDLVKLGLTNVDDALAAAMANIKRVYGEPSALSWSAGIMEVSGKAPDFDSSYFLDRSFWRKVSESYPEGVLVVVPKRGGLLYAPASDTNAVEALKKGIAQLYATSGTARVSSAIFLFKDGKWSVFQPPISR
jgi:uncharacterized protein YtpQ (UPF0354 family)